MVKIIDWNIAFTRQPWRELVTMDADVALLQETCTPPPEIADQVQLSPYPHWLSEGFALRSLIPARVVKLSDRVEVEWFEQVMPHRGEPEPHQMPVSAIGLSDAAVIKPRDGTEPFIVVSMYGAWQGPHPYAGRNGWIYSDASAHRIISDLTTFMHTYEAHEPEHRIIAAGDLNVSFDDDAPFSARARTIRDRLSALGLEYMGPRYPHGRKEAVRRAELSESSLEIPTYYTVSQAPATAAIQLDHVFVSRGLHNDVAVRAMNDVDEWGSSDHCRIVIDVAAAHDAMDQAAGT